MTPDPKDMTCREFQERLADLIGSGALVTSHPHYASCGNCRALVAQLETIAEAARQLLPIEEEPKEDLWDRIELAIRREKQ